MSHVDIAQLRSVAQSDDLKFTNGECDHLSICPDCLRASAHAVAAAKGKIGVGEYRQSDSENE
jgi:hypothetical protein